MHSAVRAFAGFDCPGGLRVYLLGLAGNLVYLAVLLSFDVSRSNLYPPSPGAPTVWDRSDVGTYVRSASAFLETGVFAGSDGLPDAHRTVGYPAFLCVAMAVGGDHWVPLVWILQALLFASIYPALAFTAREWFSATDRQVRILLLAYALVGAGWAYTPILLTDQPFAACLWGALALGTCAVRRGGAGFWTGHFLLLGAAASIRPTLALFPLAFFALTLALRQEKPRHWRALATVFSIQMVLCQAPAIRNFIHHEVWIPSDVMVNNLSDYLAKDVLALAGEPESHGLAASQWDGRPLQERLGAQSAFAWDVFGEHPFMTAGVATVNLGLNTLETHWIQVLHYSRASLHCDLKRWFALSLPLRVFHASWAFVNGVLILAAGYGCWVLARRRRWAMLAFVLVFTLPFLYGATDAQGARFRLYLEGLVLMLALCARSTIASRRTGHAS